MKSLKEFQNSKMGKTISVNAMVNLKGGIQTPTAGTIPGGMCINGVCCGWLSDTNNGDGTTTLHGVHPLELQC